MFGHLTYSTVRNYFSKINLDRRKVIHCVEEHLKNNSVNCSVAISLLFSKCHRYDKFHSMLLLISCSTSKVSFISDEVTDMIFILR